MTKAIDQPDYAAFVAVLKARRENLSQAVRDLATAVQLRDTPPKRSAKLPIP